MYLVLGDNHAAEYSLKQKEKREKEEKKQEDKDGGYKRPKGGMVTLSTSTWVNREDDTPKGPKHLPFHDWIEERQRKYKNQPWNIDPPSHEIKLVPRKPGGIYFKEMPPNVVIKRQEYRHCDVVSFLDPAPAFCFYPKK